MKKLLMLMLCIAAPARAQTPDTSYTVGPDQGNAAGIYPHSFILTRKTSTLGVVIQGNAQAGSCANVWCALVPSSSGFGQSGGTFSSFNAAAHEVVRVWNQSHPGDTLITPVVVPPPVDTTKKIDSSYSTVRISPNPEGAVTAYYVYHGDARVGTVIQAPAGRWSAYLNTATQPLATYTTLKASAQRLVHEFLFTVTPTPVDTTKRVDTVTVTRTVRDTVIVTKYDTLPGRIDSVIITRPVYDTVTVVRVDTVTKAIGTDTVWTYVQANPTNPLGGGDFKQGIAWFNAYDAYKAVFWQGNFVGLVAANNDSTWRVYLHISNQMEMPSQGDYPTLQAALQRLVPIQIKLQP